MKKLIFLLPIVIFSLLFGGCNDNDKDDDTRRKLLHDISKETYSFFTQYLSDHTRTFDKSINIELSEITQYRDIVWKAWREANNSFSEEKLITLSSLSTPTINRWNLPHSLEPNAVMPYYWGSKGNNKPENGYPMYLYLHGSGPKETEWNTGLEICENFNDAPSAYFIPQIPNEGKYYRWWQKSKQYAWEKLLRLALLSGDIDANRVYFLGISEGGYGSQRMASFYADYLAGAGPMAGGEPLKNAPAENCRNIAFSLRTGAKDTGFYRNILSTYVKEAFDSLQNIYPEYFIHNIELIPEMGHTIDYNPTTVWLKDYVRNPYPKHISWENFEMDGLYRKGFYNLAVIERSNSDTNSRTYYQMDIIGNNIALKIDQAVYETIEKDPIWEIEMKFIKKYIPATKGKIIVYLSNELVDLSKELTLAVNGKKVFEGIAKPDIKSMINSCATFYDPERIYPVAIEVEF